MGEEKLVYISLMSSPYDRIWRPYNYDDNLVGGRPTPLKNNEKWWSSSVGIIIPNIYMYIYVYIYMEK